MNEHAEGSSLTIAELGHTCLHWAAMDGWVDVADLLLAADPTAIDASSTGAGQRGQTPLMWAAVAGRVAMLKFLLRKGADRAAADGRGYRAIHHAAQYGHVVTVHVLIEEGDDPEVTDQAGHTPLHWAAYQGHFPLIQYLCLIRNVHRDSQDSVGMTPLHRAAQRDNQLEVLTLLRVGADRSFRDLEMHTAHEVAVRCHSHLAAKELLHKRHRERYSLYRMGVVIFYYLLFALSCLVYWHTIYRMQRPFQ